MVDLTRSSQFLLMDRKELRKSERCAVEKEVDIETGREMESGHRGWKEPLDGSSVRDEKKMNKWREDLGKNSYETRKAKVITHKAPRRYLGSRPYTQTYEHYKYYGFAGCGATTSYACNPKLHHLKVLEPDLEEMQLQIMATI